MAFLFPYVKLVVGGSVNNADTWSVGMHGDTGIDELWSQADCDAFAEQALSAFVDEIWTPAASPWAGFNASATSVSSATFYQYDINSVLVRESKATTSAVSGTGTAPKPAYTAACVSMLTDAYGRSYRGRMYMPATSATVTTATLQYTIAQGHADAVANWLVLWLAGFDSALPATPGVVSSTRDIITPITAVALDSIPDTQRGRQSTEVATARYTAVVTA